MLLLRRLLGHSGAPSVRHQTPLLIICWVWLPPIAEHNMLHRRRGPARRRVRVRDLLQLMCQSFADCVT